ncbi:Retrovirus-related Pol polyprotein from transposon TNT 1-94 [Sesamum angolense]|uniref:Retrovirus-related Pol polyprotein from transposon TNT 1-94 n=1 Tax=Sesamum angolense TaxID=2727404 RepID=A0AAE1T9J6_9LAMI|nr:Retrovirus-related Pol polyprotein from transposon TNT 1-94 [Sesamum angolense]
MARTRIRRGLDADRISNLPSNVIDNILTLLPLHDAVRTSVLSKGWQYKWVTVPYLVFDWTFNLSGNYSIESIIYQVLLLHRGPIVKFKFCGFKFGPDINNWLYFLSDHRVEELVLMNSVYNPEQWLISHNLFTFDHLMHLFLANVEVRLPSTFKGFRRLLSLDLISVEFEPEELNMFISKCPMLDLAPTSSLLSSPTDISFTPCPSGSSPSAGSNGFHRSPLFPSLHSAAYKSPRVFRRRVVRTDDKSLSFFSIPEWFFTCVVLYLCGLWGLSDRVVVVQPVVVLVVLLVAVRIITHLSFIPNPLSIPSPAGPLRSSKMKGILIQQKVFKSIDGKYAENVSDDKKRDNDDDVKAAIKYGRDNVCLDTVINGLKSKEMDIKTNKTSQSNNEVNMFGSVSMANQKRCDIQGNVCLSYSDGYKLTLRNVRYVPDLNHNLMSCAALEEEGLEGRWGKGIMKVMKGSLTVFKADRRRNLYVCTVDYDILAASVTDFDKTSLWHKRKWKILVENQTGKKLKVLRTDNGLEFCNQSFSNLCDECGIKRHKTNPYTPQQNGVAERMNRTLLEKIPLCPFKWKIPESVWTSNAVDISSLRVFGCSAFVHQSVDKLAPRSQKCVFIGYPDGIKGYRLWLRSQPGF